MGIRHGGKRGHHVRRGMRSDNLQRRQFSAVRGRPVLIHFSRNHARRLESIPPVAEPFQPLLLSDQVALTRIRPERNERRFYRLQVWPDLFGGVLSAV